MLGRSILIPNRANDVAWTQFYGVMNKRRPGGARDYYNSLSMTNAAPIGPTTLPNVAVVTQNFRRALLIIQNLSTATAPDTAPVLFFSFGTVPGSFANLALPPGVGIVLDVRVPTDAIYCLVGQYSDTGGTTKVQGIISEGTVTDPDNDTVNISETGQLREIVRLLKKALGEPASQSTGSDVTGQVLEGQLLTGVF
jgi:hypothetical protein